MKTLRYRIPFLHPLSPLEMFAPAGDLARTFPFSEPRLRHYYLARNAIWYGVDALGLKPGDGVLVPAYHHGIEVEVLRAKGLIVHYYRVDERMGMDFEHLERLSGLGARALYVIHYLGFPQPIDRIRDFVSRHSLPLIEDCALSLFSRAPAGPLGSFGDIGIFCLYKTLAVPHGGTLILNRDGLPLPPEPKEPDWISTAAYAANRCLDHFDLHGGGAGQLFSGLGRAMGRLTKRTMRAEAVPIDTNELDLSEIPLGMSRVARSILFRTQAAEVVRIRRRNYEHLISLLDGGVRVLFPELPAGVCPLSLPILVPDKPAAYERLLESGVETVNLWFRRRPDVPEGAFPEVEFLRRHVLEVPIHQGLRPDHVEFIAARVRRIARW
jgi:hypothetical protein